MSGIIYQLLGFSLLVSIWFWLPEPMPSKTTSRSLASSETSQNCFRVLDVLYERSKGLLKDHERQTSYFYPGRTIRAFEAANAEELDALFNPTRGGISYEDFLEIYWAIKSGELKVAPYQEKFIDDMHHMIDDHGPFFWHQDNRVFHILETLRRTDQNWGMIQGRNASALATEKALGLSEKSIIERALGEHMGRPYEDLRWFHRFRNFFFPHYKKIVSLVEYNTSVRKRLQLMYMADEPFDHALNGLGKSTDYLLDEADVSTLRRYIGDTGSKLNETRQEIERIYGGELTIERPLRQDSVNLSELDRALKGFKEQDDHAPQSKVDELFFETNRDLDELDRVLNRTYTRDELGPYQYFPTRDLHNTHLKIRFPYYANMTGVTKGRHHSFLSANSPRNAEYSFTIEWTVTVRHEKTVRKQRMVTKTDSEGKSTTEWEDYDDTETWYSTYTETRIDHQEASYAQIFANHIEPDLNKIPSLPYAYPRGAHAVSATNGSPSVRSVNRRQIDQILREASEARATERPFMDHLTHEEQTLSQLVARYQNEIYGHEAKTREAISTLDRSLEAMIANIKQLDELMDEPLEVSQRRWVHDIREDFDARHRLMKDRYLNLIQRIRHLREQIVREHKSLGIDYSLPDHSEAIEQLRLIHQRYRRIQMGMAAGTALSGAAIGADLYYGAHEPSYESKTRQFLDFIDEQVDSLTE